MAQQGQRPKSWSGGATASSQQPQPEPAVMAGTSTSTASMSSQNQEATAANDPGPQNVAAAQPIIPTASRRTYSPALQTNSPPAPSIQNPPFPTTQTTDNAQISPKHQHYYPTLQTNILSQTNFPPPQLSSHQHVPSLQASLAPPPTDFKVDDPSPSTRPPSNPTELYTYTPEPLPWSADIGLVPISPSFEPPAAVANVSSEGPDEISHTDAVMEEEAAAGTPAPGDGQPVRLEYLMGSRRLTYTVDLERKGVSQGEFNRIASRVKAIMERNEQREWNCCAVTLLYLTCLALCFQPPDVRKLNVRDVNAFFDATVNPNMVPRGVTWRFVDVNLPPIEGGGQYVYIDII